MRSFFNQITTLCRFLFDCKRAIFYFSGKGYQAATVGLGIVSGNVSPVIYERLFLSLLDKENTKKLAKDVALKVHNTELDESNNYPLLDLMFEKQLIKSMNVR